MYMCIIFVGHLEHVTILIGISVGKSAVAGVICQPFWEDSGRLVWGLIGRGIGRFQMQIPSIPTPLSLSNYTYVISRSTYDKGLTRLMEHLKPCKIIKTGGVGYKV